MDTGGVERFQLGITSVIAVIETLPMPPLTGLPWAGDAADGAAFFAARRANDSGLYSYAGVLSGTNLGAPLTDTEGSAKWVGSFVYEGRAPIDFVLNVSFGTGAGAGEIEAIVQINCILITT